MLPRGIRLATVTFVILALELTLIRWMSQQVRVFAYFTNILIVAAFLGIGIGTAFRRHADVLIRATLPITAVLAITLRYSNAMGLMFLSFPDRAMALWGADGLRSDETFLINVLVMLVLLGIVTAIFATLGSQLGALFDEFEPLRAYTIDLLGSACGVAAATVLAATRTSPPVWIAVSLLPILLFHSRSVISLLAFTTAVVFASLSVEGARFSPYSRIDIEKHDGPRPWYMMSTNRDHHQLMRDFSPAAVAADPAIAPAAAVYDMPFRAADTHDRALVVGAGTGNDVAAALRQGFRQVVAVEIDPLIRDVGVELHPERPYADARVRSVVADARTYFEAHDGERFDLVCFGLLDSHSMFSSMSTLRLDNYVYTVEALRKAWALTNEHGVLAISFMVFRQTFIAERLSRSLHDATGQWPLVVRHSSEAYTFVVARGVAAPGLAARLGRPVMQLRSPVEPSTDDWPFLYLRPHTFPTGYVAVLASFALLALVATGAAYGSELRHAFDVPLFFMGAAFLLIETRAVTDLSLLYGSTWIVNAAVFGGVLIVAAAANAAIAWKPALARIGPILLLAALVVSYFVANTVYATLPLAMGRFVGVLVNVLPVGCAGLLFSSLLRSSRAAASGLGSNLVGAVFGGLLEYLSIVTGLRALTAIAAMLYAAGLLVAARGRRLQLSGAAPPAGPISFRRMRAAQR